MAVHGFRDQRLALLLVDDVGHDSARRPDLAELGDGRGILGFVAAGDHHCGTAFQQAARQALTDAAVAAVTIATLPLRSNRFTP